MGLQDLSTLSGLYRKDGELGVSTMLGSIVKFVKVCKILQAILNNMSFTQGSKCSGLSLFFVLESCQDCLQS